MGLISLLFGVPEEKYITIKLPVTLIKATDTMIHILNQDGDEATRDSIVCDALGQYIKKHLYIASDKDERRTEIRHIKNFRTGGQAQMRDE